RRQWLGARHGRGCCCCKSARRRPWSVCSRQLHLPEQRGGRYDSSSCLKSWPTQLQQLAGTLWCRRLTSSPTAQRDLGARLGYRHAPRDNRDDELSTSETCRRKDTVRAATHSA